MMNTFRARLSSAFVLVLGVAGGSYFFEVENEVTGTSVAIPQSEVDAFRLRSDLLSGDDKAAREAAEKVMRATGQNPAPAFKEAAWCVPDGAQEIAGSALASAHCMFDPVCAYTTCAALEGREAQKECVSDCPRRASCVATESAAFERPLNKVDPSGPLPVFYRCDTWRLTPALKARLDSVRPDVGVFAWGEGAKARAEDGLEDVAEDRGGP